MSSAERRWLENATRFGGSFVKTFANACYCADSENYAILLPILEQMMAKYPNYSREDIP